MGVKNNPYSLPPRQLLRSRSDPTKGLNKNFLLIHDKTYHSYIVAVTAVSPISCSCSELILMSINVASRYEESIPSELLSCAALSISKLCSWCIDSSKHTGAAADITGGVCLWYLHEFCNTGSKLSFTSHDPTWSFVWQAKASINTSIWWYDWQLMHSAAVNSKKELGWSGGCDVLLWFVFMSFFSILDVCKQWSY